MNNYVLAIIVILKILAFLAVIIMAAGLTVNMMVKGDKKYVRR